MKRKAIHKCECEICQSGAGHAEKEVHHMMNVLMSSMDEQERRWYAGLEAKKLGHGGLEKIARITGLNVNTIRRGQEELAQDLSGRPSERVRVEGGGRKTIKKKEPSIEEAIEAVIDEDEIAGLPTSDDKWVRKSLRKLSSELAEKSYKVSRTTVGQLLKGLDYKLVANRKSLIKTNHPDRDRQFRYMKRVKKLFLDAGFPVISVDAKQKVQIGDFHNKGKSWRQEAEKVLVHDFPSDATGRAVPYGIYDIAHNQGYVYVGNSYDTPEFAAHCIAQWWANPDRPRFQREDMLLIFCDAGGSNSCRFWLWKHEVQQQLANRFGLRVMICHYPTGTSKYNPIEYRLFSQISLNWAGKPLRSFQTVLNYIRGTTTQTGLSVRAFLVDRLFEKGRSVSEQQRQSICLNRRSLCPNWNYIISPQPLSTASIT